MKMVYFSSIDGKALWRSRMWSVPRPSEMIATTDRTWWVVRVIGHRVIVDAR